MKNLLKKLKENWLDYLIVLISVFAICFVYLFTAFYQPKENEQTINKENIIKVLRDKKNAQQGNFRSEMTAFYIGNMSPYNTNNYFIEFYLNVMNVNISLYDYYPDNLEVEFEYYITASAKYLNEVGMQTNATFNPTSDVIDTFVMTTQAINSIYDIENITIEFNMNEISYESGYDPEDIYFDFGINYDIDIYLNDINDIDHNINYQNVYNSFGINASNLPVSVRQIINDNIFVDINDVRANTSTRDFVIKFNTINAGYNSGFENGYQDGYDTAFDYALDLGYQNGYNDGIIAGSSDFNILNFIRSLFDLLWGVLDVEMLPNIKLIYIVAIPLVLSVIRFILGWFR